MSLGRVTDRGLRVYLETEGVKVGELGGTAPDKLDLEKPDLDKQGYVIRVTDSGVLVAGRTAQGLFYGVQTLRQLPRPEGSGGKTLAVPNLVIRDLPITQLRRGSVSRNRGAILSHLL